MDKLKALLLNRYFVFAVYTLFAVAAAIGQMMKAKPGDTFSRYNNYLIFKESFTNLKNGVNMYVPHPEQHYDLYKYSPSFAVLFAPFGWLNDTAGLILWNLLNALPLLLAVFLIPYDGDKKKIYVLWFIVLELMTNMQNSQSNGLIAALLIGAFVSFERHNNMLAALFIILSVYIKVFGLLMAVMFMVYEKRQQFMLWFAAWGIIIFMLPLLFTSSQGYIIQMEGWMHLLRSDHGISDGISVFGIMHSWFGIVHLKGAILIFGLLLMLLPILFIRHFISFRFRLWYFTSLLVWLVIFNHRAESPTYIIATAGAALWYFQKDQPSRFETGMMILLFVLTVLSPTDVFPRILRNEWVVPYSLKALPCVIVYFKIFADMIRQTRSAPQL
ncbi:MAG: DUF2029 domain-containing protein [Bacteroidia bacterium]|nr:DUF2029 domain-containing protein [Bacteroidia bacterium]